MTTSLTIDELLLKLSDINMALGGDELNPPDPASNLDPLNYCCQQILESLCGIVFVVPPDEMDEARYWFQQYAENMPNGDALTPPPQVPNNDLLRWFFQQIHELYTGESNIVPPPEEMDDLRWYLELIYEDILASPGGVPFRFKLALGELLLTGDTLPQFDLDPNTGELTVNDSTLPSEYTNWRVTDGRLMADAV